MMNRMGDIGSPCFVPLLMLILLPKTLLMQTLVVKLDMMTENLPKQKIIYSPYLLNYPYDSILSQQKNHQSYLILQVLKRVFFSFGLIVIIDGIKPFTVFGNRMRC